MHNPFHNGHDLNGALLRQRQSVSPSSRALKRAKSARDICRPSLPRRSISSSAYQDNKRKVFAQFRMLTRSRTDGAECGIFDSATPESESNFDFNCSDSDSLPDLSDCASSPSSPQSAITPTKTAGFQYFENTSGSVESRKRLFVDQINKPNLAEQNGTTFSSCPSFDASSNPFLTPPRSTLCIQNPEFSPEPKSPHAIFAIPELVHKIIEYADAQHTQGLKQTSPIQRQTPQKQNPSAGEHSVMHSCLLVNKLFNQVARKIMGSRVLFSKEESFVKFSQNDASYFQEMKPRTFVLNKLFYAKQASLERVASSLDCSEMQWLEIFMCPKLKPPMDIFHPQLKTLVVAGSKVFDDELLVSVAEKCPNLEVVDLRACELVTDCGVYALAQRCHRLRSINFGRKRKGHLITDHSILSLVNNNKHLQTVGLAGCHVTDRAIWELAVNCGKRLERLSLNCCPYIGNQSVPAILNHNLLPRLCVLEIKNVDNLTHFDPIVNFKRKQISNGIFIMIETCETLLARLRDCELKMDRVISQRIFRDISEWANSADNDLPFSALRARTHMPVTASLHA